MFENGKVQLVRTVKHLSFLRNAGLGDLWDQEVPRYGARIA